MPDKTAHASRSIPPIEIGSFVSLAPDDSEFIGSGSGVFFANTVFRAFARLAPAAGTGPDRGAGGVSEDDAPGSGSAHTYLVAPEDGAEQTIDSGPREQDGPGSLVSQGRLYGVAVPGLGAAPPPETAQKLLMLYFRNWHPFFPFLHGPTFMNSVDRFYEEPELSGDTPAQLHPSRLARAITFQCIFNIAALSSGQALDPAFRIQSSSALTSLMGIVFTNHDIATLQALLAAELYLTITMSLRAASTINGALTRTMYNSGFHRCPSRYVQLPSDKSDIRKRVFWCAYVLDRFLSQALGHPCSIGDAHVDVCIPGMAELHKAARPRDNVAAGQSTLNEEVLDHLPEDRAAGAQKERDPAQGHEGLVNVTESGNSLSVCSPAQHYKAGAREASSFVLSYFVTYSRLMGEIVNDFHRSIHCRTVSHETTQDLSCRIHWWWNSLPSAFQDETHDGTPSAAPQEKSPFVAFFTVLYNYLTLLVNRPFLSLPTGRKEFRSSLQTALAASRCIIVKLRGCTDDPFLMAWPGTLSAVWTSGLVIAFASLLELYPLAKGSSEIRCCLTMLETMAHRWTSARHCHGALTKLLERLTDVSIRSRASELRPDQTLDVSRPDTNTGSDERSAKRQRVQGDPSIQPPSQHYAPTSITAVDTFPVEDLMPVVEHTGPEFGFDAPQIGGEFFCDPLDPDMAGLFSNAGWDAYLQGFGQEFGG